MKILLLRYSFITISLAIPFNAIASKWLEVSAEEGHLGTRTLVETSSFVHDGDRRELWVMRTSADEQRARRTPDGLCMSTKSLFAFDCKKRVWAMKYNICYTEEYGLGRSTTTANFMDSTATIPIVPDSLADTLSIFACASVQPQQSKK